MKVVFVQCGPSIEHASMMVRSCKRLGYEVWQLSDDIAPPVPEIDFIERKTQDAYLMHYRAKRLAEIATPYVMLDTDMIVANDISDGFGEDVALTWREKDTVIFDEDYLKMPYNGGIIFVNNQDFMRDVAKRMETMNKKLQMWYGDQVALRDVAPNYKVRELKDPAWNFVPEHLGDTTKDVRVYHFKGTRKRLMGFCWEAIEAGRDWCE
jgi:hypothetical protein